MLDGSLESGGMRKVKPVEGIGAAMSALVVDRGIASEGMELGACPGEEGEYGGEAMVVMEEVMSVSTSGPK